MKYQILFFIVLLILSFHIGLATGRNKERNNSKCIDYETAEMIKEDNKSLNAVCVDIQQSQISDLKNNYIELSNEMKEKAEQWKKSYFWCEDRIKNLNNN